MFWLIDEEGFIKEPLILNVFLKEKKRFLNSVVLLLETKL